MPRRKGRKEALQFFVVKRLKSIIQDESVRQIISSSVLLAHEATKLGLFFFKAFFLECKRLSLRVPEPNQSVMIAFLEQVCLRCSKWARCKSTDLLGRMNMFRDSSLLQDISRKGGHERQEHAQSTGCWTDVATRFRSRCVKLCLKLGSKDKSMAARIVSASFSARWEDVLENHASVPKRVLLQCPGRKTPFGFPLPLLQIYSAAVQGAGAGTLQVFIFRSSCVLCHVKFDTEFIAQILLPYKQCVEARKSFGRDGRKDFNVWVWNHFVDNKKIDSKTRKYTFHYEIIT